uniref:Uncharacterized protein n=1 Tax=Brassica oleracea TaxID=3712 RepID=A0A3P6C4E7_BRAOL|nr:unnamed protein product [Brassica oleracea]
MKIDLVKQRRGIKLHVENLFRTGAEILTRVPNRRISKYLQQIWKPEQDSLKLRQRKEHQSIVRVKQIFVNDLKGSILRVSMLTVCVCLHSVRPNLRRLAMASSTVFTHILGDVPSSPLYGKMEVCKFLLLS